jgi:hypothetical protein
MGWKEVRTVKEFCKELRSGTYEIASLDFDLYDPYCSGTFAASEIIEQYKKGTCTLKKVILHTANEHGRAEMLRKLRKHTQLEVVIQPLLQSSVMLYQEGAGLESEQ